MNTKSHNVEFTITEKYSGITIHRNIYTPDLLGTSDISTNVMEGIVNELKGKLDWKKQQDMATIYALMKEYDLNLVTLPTAVSEKKNV